MIYSCFDAPMGQYRYFEDSTKRAVNADLPVPSFRGRETKLGVPATEAGRPLPSSAVPVGTGWNARGMVVQCGAAGGGAFGALSLSTQSMLFGGALLAVGGYLAWTEQPLSGILIGAVGAGILMG